MKAHIVGGGFGGLAAAALLIRNAELPAQDITIYEADKELGDRGVEQLLRQMMSISGGSIEMSRNGVSERFLGMPREASGDRDIPFRDVPRGSSSR